MLWSLYDLEWKSSRRRSGVQARAKAHTAAKTFRFWVQGSPRPAIFSPSALHRGHSGMRERGRETKPE